MFKKNIKFDKIMLQEIINSFSVVFLYYYSK